MDILFDFDTAVLDSNYFWSDKDAQSIKKIKDPEFYWKRVLPDKGFVYALRSIEKKNYSYGFYSRASFDHLSMDYSSAHIFRFMPSYKHFKGYFNDIGDCRIFVTRDEGLCAEISSHIPVIYMGYNYSSLKKFRSIYLLNDYPQMPFFLCDILDVCAAV